MTGSRYRLKFWGVRGTVPTPSAGKLGYGGNTSCLAVALSDDEYIILDCGTGLRMLGDQLTERRAGRPMRYHVFFSHYHFDHVEGLPLFSPLYSADSTITFYGFESRGRPIRDVLESLIAPPYFPVTMAGVPSKREYVTINHHGASLDFGDVRVSSLPLNHPDGSLSYRLEHGGHRIVFATDHEHGDEKTDNALVHFSEGADYLIYDATYLRAEYESLHRGWGHSTWYAAVQTARRAQVKTLVLFHHHPEHTDEDLEAVLRAAREELPSTEIAREGMELPF